ncbi:MAG: CHASE3 domain-containing protein [Caulobacterales bacterium]|nr:CHASE3 domain-containing protein [Caulobacterales bacterium]
MGTVRGDRALYALLAGFVALAAVVLATVWFSEQEAEASRWVGHTLQAESQLSRVRASILEAEASQRGYLLSGREDFLVPYHQASDALPSEIDELSRLTADNDRQRDNIRRLRAIIEARRVLLAQNVEIRRSGAAVPAERLERGRRLMDDSAAVVADMRAVEERLFAQRTAAVAGQRLALRIALIATTLVVFALGAFAFGNARRRLAEALRIRDELAAANEHLREEAASRAAAEAQVRQVQKMQAIGQLTGGIAHDFNNMLAIVIGSLDLAKRRLRTDVDRAEAGITSALEGAERAAQLTARLLAFSRLQPLEPRVLDVNKLVGGMSELLRRTIGEQLQVETVLAGGLWRTQVDPAQLENALVNLCVNARDAMPDGGKLTIETANSHLDDAYAAGQPDVEPGQYVMISVSDTGVGMPPDVVERAFEPFYTTKGVGRGTGLGLSQVHGFVKQSRGHVKIYSEPGVGTTIKIYLRRATDEPEAEIPVRPPGDLPRGLPGEIIVVVEDEDRVRHLSVDALRELGYTVVQASDAAQALALLALQPRVDLLFTDVVMPGLDGRRLADRARELRPDLKVLYTTGYTKNAIVHNGMLDPGVAFLAKPFTVEQLAVKVRQVLDADG